ncbi:CS1 type fimbrial major subunit [Pseudomonas poae]|uniref:Adhesin n=1 Tax=Pseudomonas poae TaxID=200451 RepID=A0AAP2S1X6_9PSED|nr:CS1 type fimbrial major subunit [Pseudomonas poae]KTC42651.1 adhesin [Pseudomonas sp. ABAC21]MCF5655087.1 adhesin [Pseudomonas poae]NMZ51253.1 adhesin [Pseudomonas poae]
MFKTLACTALSTVCLLFVPLAWAAVERETFEVFVTIPTADFYVLPVDPLLVQREQHLVYNPVTSQMSSLRAPFEVKNIGGAIAARLDSEAFLSNGTDRIDLQVTFNQVPLSLEQAQVVSSIDAKPGRRVGLEIAAVKPPEDYQPGRYFGTVHMVFDALVSGSF